ncbi:polysaccharide biosynthesis tyrosine autokinase [Xylophilus sp. GOD-11R]|uniref:polysaccharide biosynthesis tyrosine autokinase n=1 Tax=Xylophilus sp. GOD-11R TaxID=3089814 RepID=UPI00298D12C3|nr:polysaccharide biosynthesis tyrosine autokinase [Xylophilus sp. GOD-11R]WPB55480.1 polysaccharide biosynthesis tyrosine autokinase [Xylophilus sp. GOD-11R]
MKINRLLAAPPVALSPGQPAYRASTWKVVREERRLVALVTGLCLAAGLVWALAAPQVYETNIAIQVEDDERPAGAFLDAASSSALSVKTPATGETEILKSRMILMQAIENTRLYINAEPKYVPLVGSWLAARATALSVPGVFGFGGYVSGNERITVAHFDVPAALEGSRFTLTAGRDGAFVLTHPKLAEPIRGKVGEPLDVDRGGSTISLLVGDLHAAPGAAFSVMRHSQQQTLIDLLAGLKVIEKGKQSGMLDVSWQSTDRFALTDVLNEIGRLYVRQNVDRKTAVAEKTLAFLDTELPRFKQQLEESEDYYNRFRNQNGTVSLDDEARNALGQAVDLQAKLFDAKQRRLELVGRFTDQHPTVATLDAQIAGLTRELGGVEGRIRRMPMLQQTSLRMQRDIKANTDMYAALLNSALQMRLAKEGRIGNVRLIDEAVLPEKAAKPNRPVVLAFSLVAGLFLGIFAALTRQRVGARVNDAEGIEAGAGLNVYCNVPASRRQRALSREMARGRPGLHVLAMDRPEDAAIEGLRRLRATLRVDMQDAPDNRILVTSATAGAGKTFIAVNLAAVLASSGKRVMLIDADVQAQGVCNYLNLTQTDLTDAAQDRPASGHALHTGVLPNLDVLSAARVGIKPGELLTSDAFTRLLSQLSERYDSVVIDAPPILQQSAAAAIAPFASTLLLVASARETSLDDIHECVKRMSHVGCAFNGVVLNRAAHDRRARASHRLGRKPLALSLPRP